MHGTRDALHRQSHNVFVSDGEYGNGAHAIIKPTDVDNESMNLSFQDEFEFFCLASKASKLACLLGLTPTLCSHS